MRNKLCFLALLVLHSQLTHALLYTFPKDTVWYGSIGSGSGFYIPNDASESDNKILLSDKVFGGFEGQLPVSFWNSTSFGVAGFWQRVDGKPNYGAISGEVILKKFPSIFSRKHVKFYIKGGLWAVFHRVNNSGENQIIFKPTPIVGFGVQYELRRNWLLDISANGIQWFLNLEPSWYIRIAAGKPFKS